MFSIPSVPPCAAAITGLVLAGGRGVRMGGADKGLLLFRGQPLALHALERLAPQVDRLMLSANRHLPDYAAFGVPVWPDAPGGYAGPLAGMLAGLAHCSTPWLAAVPCDAPLFPPNLVARLADAVAHSGGDAALAAAPGAPGQPLRPQPVFCLLRATLAPDLERFLRGGGHKVQTWLAQHRAATVLFDRPGDDAHAFANANTLTDLHVIQGY